MSLLAHNVLSLAPAPLGCHQMGLCVAVGEVIA